MKKPLTIIIVVITTLLIFFLLTKDNSPNPNSAIYPNTTEAPVLQLIWQGTLNPEDTIRYTPYGIWESVQDSPDGTLYEPANEMQFYISTSASDYLAVAPGIITMNETFDNSAGLLSVKYGENYIITYLHIIPDPSLKPGTQIETGDIIGKMEKRHSPTQGEETWWEIQLTINRDGIYRTLPPYDYFDQDSRDLLDSIAQNAKEYGPGESTKPPYWTVATGCSWIQYTGEPEWWDSNRFGGPFQKESENKFIKNINPNWKVVDNKGFIIGPTDICN